MSARPLSALLLTLALLASGCAKDTDEWLADLESEDPYVRLMAVAALGTREVGTHRTDEVVAALLDAKNDDKDARVRAQASKSLTSLVKVAHGALVTYVCSNPDDELAARQLHEMAAESDDALEGVAAALADAGCANRIIVARILGALHQRGVPDLLTHLRTGDRTTKRLAVHGLMLAGKSASDALPELTELTAGEDAELAEEARAAIAKIRGNDG